MLDGLKIIDGEVRIGSTGIMIPYTEGWVVKDALGVVTEFFIPPQPEPGRFVWTGADFTTAKKKLVAAAGIEKPTADFESYLMALFYQKLGASKPEYAGTFVVQDVV